MRSIIDLVEIRRGEFGMASSNKSASLIDHIADAVFPYVVGLLLTLNFMTLSIVIEKWLASW